MEENYYLLLGLDPKVREWTQLEKAIKDCQRRWSMQKNQGRSEDRRKAERYLQLLPAIKEKLKDEKERNIIALEAVKFLKTRKEELNKKIDDLISVIKEPILDARGFKLLIKEVGGKVDESEVIVKLKKKGITVEAENSKQKNNINHPKIDTTIAKNIHDNLKHLGFISLYDFLGGRSQSSPKSLYDIATEIYREVKNSGKIDPDSTAKLELAGHAKIIFRDSETKEKYDNTLAVESMNDLKSHLEIAGRDSFLGQQVLDHLIKEARSKGVSKVLALEYIEEYAKKRKWKIHNFNKLPSDDLKLCGFCGEVALKPDAMCCGKCGKELVQPCPKCGHPTLTQDSCCSKCGFCTGDAQLVQRLLSDGNKKIAKGRFDEAESDFKKALDYWNDWEPAIQGIKIVQQARSNQKSSIETINKLIQKRKLEAALDMLAKLKKEYISEEIRKTENHINDGLKKAKKAFTDAMAYKTTGKHDRVMEKLYEALTYCVDYHPAVQDLSSIPPPSITELDGGLVGPNVELSWTPVQSQGHISYKIQRKKSAYPFNLDDGITVGEVKSTFFQESELPSGIPWYYAIYTLRDDVPSTDAKFSGPHIRLEDPQNIFLEAGNNQVSISWDRPQGCKEIEIWRAKSSPPLNPGIGKKITVSEDTAVDQGLKNGMNYGYLIVACYPDPKRAYGLLKSPGYKTNATPISPPPAVIDLQIQCESEDAILKWTPPQRGSVQIRMTRKKPTYTSGRIISLNKADDFGNLIPINGNGRTQIVLNSSEKKYFIPLTVISQTAVLGDPVVITNFKEISNLQSNLQNNTIQLSWIWPPQVASVKIGWRYDTYPKSPESAVGGMQKVSLNDYKKSGKWILENALKERYYFSVFTCDEEANVFSSGVHVLENNCQMILVNYRIQTSLFLNRSWVELKTKSRIKTLPPLTVVLKKEFVPLNISDGRAIADVRNLTFRNGRALIKLSRKAGIGYVKIFFKGKNSQAIRLLPAEQKKLKIRK